MLLQVAGFVVLLVSFKSMVVISFAAAMGGTDSNGIVEGSAEDNLGNSRCGGRAGGLKVLANETAGIPDKCRL